MTYPATMTLPLL